jgi:hypothetical protein
MRTVSFEEYENAKLAVIQGVEYHEESNLKEDGRISKTYATEKNGNFYEVTTNGITEFWSDKHSESRYYDGRTREEVIAQYEEKLEDAFKENARLSVERSEFRDSMNQNAFEVISLRKRVKELEGKLSAINTIVAA